MADHLEYLEEVMQYEGPHTIAAFIMETVTGTNGILIPPDGYLQGDPRPVHEVRDPDDLRRGDGRLRPHGPMVRGRPLGRRARPDDHGQGADQLVPAARRRGHEARASPSTSTSTVYYGGLTYSSHPISCAAAIAAVSVLRDEDMVGNAARLDPVMKELLADLQARHPSVGTVRSIGLFGVFELVR